MTDIDALAPEVRLTALLEETVRRNKRRKLLTFYPDTGPLRRERYPKHQEFLAAGAEHRVRMMMAANRIGKSEGCGLYEATLHMTGRYPEWWQGRRFDRPVRVWVAGDTGKTLREILQVKLLGQWGNFGTGLVPGDDLIRWTSKQGVAESIDTFTVKHANGGASHGVFKSYDQGRESFQGSEQDVILLDEEPPLDIYVECLMRTMTTGGIIMLTFTPLLGMTKLIKHMRESGVWEIGATWDDVPHLSDEAKAELWANTPAHMRDARAKGIPQRGSGIVFPVSEETITIEKFMPEKSWPTIIGLDFGWDHPTAAVKLAHDRDRDVIFVIGAYRQREATPLMFAAAIRAWQIKWCPVAWPHDGLHHKDLQGGKTLKALYQAEGLQMLDKPASFSDEKLEHSVETGIMEMLDYMQSGRFYVMEHLREWFEEFRDYYREDGIIVKERDDLMSATRYAFMMRRFAITKPARFASQAGEREQVNWRTL